MAAVLTLTATLGAARLASQLSSGGFDVPGSESVRQRQVVENASGVSPGAGIIALVETPDGTRSADARRRVAQVARILRDERTVVRVTTPYTPRGARQVARDGTSVFVQAQFRPGDDDERMAAAGRVRDPLGDTPGVSLGGPAAVAHEITGTVQKDLTRAELIALPILFVLALWVFRGAVAALLMPVMGAIVIEGAFFVVGLINTLTPMSVFSVNLIVAIGLGLAVDYSLLMITRFRQEIAQRALGPALVATMRSAGVSVAFSAVTVAVALSGLMVFPMNFLFSMGLGGLIVALFAGVAALLLLPAMLWVLGHRINALAPRAWQRAPEPDGARSGFWYRLSHGVLRRPLVVATVTSAALLTLAVPVLGTHFIPVDSTVLPRAAESRTVADVLDRDYALDTGTAMNVAVDTAGVARPGQAARACARTMAGIDGVEAVTPPARAGGDVWSYAVVSRDPPLADPSVELVGRLRDADCRGTVLVGGIAADFVDQRSALGRGLPWAVAIVAVVTVVALFLMTGSVVLPVKAVLLNVVSIAATIGVVVWIFQEGHLEGPLAFESRGGLGLTQPILLGAVAFGLSTDYAVFLLSRIRELRMAGHSNEESIAVGLQHTGRVVTAAALLFAVAVGAFAMSRVIVLKEIGVGTALAVLIDASIVRALLVPSTMGILGEANWWAPRFLRRLHDRIGVREG